jgi:hypothetical protein
MDYLEFALKSLGDAADARNKLTHGLFKVEPYSGELLSVHRRPATKVPVITRRDILKQLNNAIALCERAIGLLGSTVVAIILPELLDDTLRRGPQQPSPEKP